MKRPIAYVAGTGRGIPAKVMTNHDFAALGLETSHEWIVERTGIVERRIAAADETTCSMAVTAARQAMAKAGVHAGELDAIVLSTATPDRLLPATAVERQAQLGATRAAAFDLSAACTGWLYSMTVAEGLIQSADHILDVARHAVATWTGNAKRPAISRFAASCVSSSSAATMRQRLAEHAQPSRNPPLLAAPKTGEQLER